MEKITLARNAMATRFEFVLRGSDPVRLRAAGEEALDEIDRIESQMSLYRSGSEISAVNLRASFEPVPVSPEVFALLERARSFWELTNGSFDITIAPLVRCWGFMQGSGSRPTDQQIAEARERVGTNFLDLHSASSTVRFQRAGLMLDLGSIGKGYALDVAADVLRDAGVENALLHGGTSTIYALGQDTAGPWKIAIDQPALPNEAIRNVEPQSGTAAIVELCNEALSVSAVWGKFFTLDGKTYGHVIDPRTGWPAEEALHGSVVVQSAADSDALSTGVLLGNKEEIDRLRTAIPGMRYLQARSKNGALEWRASGIDLLNKA